MRREAGSGGKRQACRGARRGSEQRETFRLGRGRSKGRILSGGSAVCARKTSAKPQGRRQKKKRTPGDGRWASRRTGKMGRGAKVTECSRASTEFALTHSNVRTALDRQRRPREQGTGQRGRWRGAAAPAERIGARKVQETRETRGGESKRGGGTESEGTGGGQGENENESETERMSKESKAESERMSEESKAESERNEGKGRIGVCARVCVCVRGMRTSAGRRKRVCG